MMQAEDKIVHVQEKGDTLCHGDIIISPQPSIEWLPFLLCSPRHRSDYSVPFSIYAILDDRPRQSV
jgi:hypothetical protein